MVLRIFLFVVGTFWVGILLLESTSLRFIPLLYLTRGRVWKTVFHFSEASGIIWDYFGNFGNLAAWGCM